MPFNSVAWRGRASRMRETLGEQDSIRVADAQAAKVLESSGR